MPTISSSPPSFPSSSILFDFCFKRDWTSASSLLSSSFSPSSLLPLVLHKDVGGATALHRAVHWYAPVDLVKAILHVPVAASAEQAAAAAADPEQAAPLLLSPLTKRMLTARTMDGYSPLHLYCKDTPGDSLVFELLASLYPPALLLTDKSGRTPSALLLSSSDPALDPSLRERCLTLEAAERSRQRVSLNQRSVSFCLASLSRRDPSLLDPPTLSNHNKLPFASFTSRVLLFFSVREPGITSIIVSFVGVSGRSSSSSTASSRCHRKRDGGAPKQVNSLKAKYQSLLSAVVPSNWCAEAFADPFLPLVLDLGCGGGEWLLALADRLPSHNHLGLEIREEAVADCEREAAGRGNLSYLCCNVLAGDLQRVMGLLKGPVLAVCVNFPDPNWKGKHAKRRMMTASVMRTVASNLDEEEGVLFVRTDVEEVSEEADRLVREGGAMEEGGEGDGEGDGEGTLVRTLRSVPTERELYVKRKAAGLSGKKTGGAAKVLFVKSYVHRRESHAFRFRGSLRRLSASPAVE